MPDAGSHCPLLASADLGPVARIRVAPLAASTGGDLLEFPGKRGAACQDPVRRSRNLVEPRGRGSRPRSLPADTVQYFSAMEGDLVARALQTVAGLPRV